MRTPDEVLPEWTDADIKAIAELEGRLESMLERKGGYYTFKRSDHAGFTEQVWAETLQRAREAGWSVREGGSDVTMQGQRTRPGADTSKLQTTPKP